MGYHFKFLTRMQCFKMIKGEFKIHDFLWTSPMNVDFGLQIKEAKTKQNNIQVVLTDTS